MCAPEKNHICTRHTHNTCVQSHVSLGGKRWARRGGMAMVQDTQGKRWKRPQVSRILARPTRVLWQEALLTDVCWRDVCPLAFCQISTRLSKKKAPTHPKSHDQHGRRGSQGHKSTGVWTLTHAPVQAFPPAPTRAPHHPSPPPC